MANRVVVSPQADLDVDAAWNYIAASSVTAAVALIDRITLTSQTLADAPMAGRARPELRDGLRSFPIGSYVIFYILISGGIEIIRIMHGKREISTKHMR